jgi:hypothetical protein
MNKATGHRACLTKIALPGMSVCHGYKNTNETWWTLRRHMSRSSFEKKNVRLERLANTPT